MLDDHKNRLEAILKKQKRDKESVQQRRIEKDQKLRDAVKDFDDKKEKEIKPAFEELLEVFESYGRHEVHITEENDRLPNYTPRLPPGITFHLVSRTQATENSRSLRFIMRLDAEKRIVRVFGSTGKKLVEQTQISLDAIDRKWVQEEFVDYVESLKK
jgi:hypothetical protein